MRTHAPTLTAALCAALLLTPVAARPAGLDPFKGLVGEWEGKKGGTMEVSCSYALTAGGSCVMETLHAPDGGDMVTMYRMDGPRLTLDHYCTLGNQPRMRSEASTSGPNTVSFAFTGATNLAKPSDAHMHRLVVHFVDADHFTQEWTMRTKGKDQVMKFEFERKKSE